MDSATAANRSRLAAALGLRRVESVRVVVGPRRTRATDTGVAHRRSHTSAISVATAQRLAAAGVPLTLTHEGVR